MHYFLIGPGGVGKSTVAPILATLLDVSVIDLDMEYMKQGSIGDDIRTYGYVYYYQKNSDLFLQLLETQFESSLFVLSSGFLCYPDTNLITTHKRAISNAGVSIRLLPDDDVEQSTNIVVQRQLQRGFDLDEQKEREKFKKRFNMYKDVGDVQVYSFESPSHIAQHIYTQLQTYEQSI